MARGLWADFALIAAKVNGVLVVDNNLTVQKDYAPLSKNFCTVISLSAQKSLMVSIGSFGIPRSN